MKDHLQYDNVSIEIVCQCAVICRRDKVVGRIYTFGRRGETVSVLALDIPRLAMLGGARAYCNVRVFVCNFYVKCVHVFCRLTYLIHWQYGVRCQDWELAET